MSGEGVYSSASAELACEMELLDAMWPACAPSPASAPSADAPYAWTFDDASGIVTFTLHLFGGLHSATADAASSPARMTLVLRVEASSYPAGSAKWAPARERCTQVSIPYLRGCSEHEEHMLLKRLQQKADDDCRDGAPSLYVIMEEARTELEAIAQRIECLICLDVAAEPRQRMTTPTCIHTFHTHCLFLWFDTLLDAHAASTAWLNKVQKASQHVAELQSGVDTARTTLTVLQTQHARVQDELQHAEAQLSAVSAIASVSTSAASAPSAPTTGTGGVGKGSKKRSTAASSTSTSLAASTGSVHATVACFDDTDASVDWTVVARRAKSSLLALTSELTSAEQRLAAAERALTSCNSSSSSGSSSSSSAVSSVGFSVPLVPRASDAQHSSGAWLSDLMADANLVCPSCRSPLPAHPTAVSSWFPHFVSWYKVEHSVASYSTMRGSAATTEAEREVIGTRTRAGDDARTAATMPARAGAAPPSVSATMCDDPVVRAYLEHFKSMCAEQLRKQRAHDGLIADAYTT